jgi:hypothetical protein
MTSHHPLATTEEHTTTMSTATAPATYVPTKFWELSADERAERSLRGTIAELTERIDASAALHGPVAGFRPELRERRDEAQARLDALLARLDRDRAARRADAAEAHLLNERPVTLVRLSSNPDAKLHVEGTFGPAECGAWDRSDDTSNGVWVGETTAYRAVHRTDVCGRCQRSLRAWAKND